MSEAIAIENSAVIVAPKKKAARPKSLKPKGKINHPKVSQMVNTAIVDLKDRGGSSLQAIKKYIAATYKVDVEKLAPFIRKHLKLAVVNGSIIQTKGKGASGSFKVSASGKKIESKHIVKVKTADQKLVKAKPKTVKSKILSKPKPKIAMKVKKVTKVKVKKSPARAPKPKKTMKKGSKLIIKTPKLSK